jgi:hypothetical protein
MSKIHLILPDPHAHYLFDNRRADWVGKLMVDLKPDVFVNLGDQWDLPSLSGYDKGKASFHGKAFRKDLDAGLEFSDRLFAPIRKAKKKRPRCIFLEGNHEERLRRVLEQQPEFEGTIGFEDFDLKRDYDDIIRYKGQTPGTIVIDGITYAHYLVTGVSGRGVAGEHPGFTLLTKHFSSVTCGHVHTFDYSVRTDANGRRLHGLVAGVYQEHDSDWAGEINRLWSRGLVIKREVEDGNYDLEWVSLKRLEREYG